MSYKDQFVTFDPAKYIQCYDDFLSFDPNWTNVNGGLAPGTATNPGQAIFNGTGTNYFYLVDPNMNGGSILPGGGQINNNFVFDLVTLSGSGNTYTLYIGLCNNSDVSQQQAVTSGIYFQYTDTVNSGNWQIVCNNASVSTVTNTSVAASTGFHNYGISINAAGTSVEFFIDHILVGTITTNFPTIGTAPTCFALSSAGNVPNMILDLWYFQNTLTTPR